MKAKKKKNDAPGDSWEMPNLDWSIPDLNWKMPDLNWSIPEWKTDCKKSDTIENTNKARRQKGRK